MTTIGEYRMSDTSNLHLHGVHISPKEPQDFVKLQIEPGMGYDYEYKIPANHMPGSFWLHTHFHGSTTIQVGGGAALALIIADPIGYLP